MRAIIACSIIAGFAFSAAGRAEAGLLVYDGTAILGASSTLGGAALGSDEGITLAATFDPSANLSPLGTGTGLYHVTAFSITVDGHGTYVGISGPDLNVFLADATSGSYKSGLLDASGVKGFYGVYASASPGFAATNPSPTTFSGFDLADSVAGYPYTIALAGVPGGLVINSFSSTTTASSVITAAVPEPSSLAMAGIAGMAGLGLAWRRRRITAA